MNLRPAIFLLASCGVYAESYALPPVIDNSAYPSTAAVPNTVPAAPSTNTLFELMGRLEQLQAEVQQLTGKVEEQANLISELKKHQTSMYADFDDRLQRIENNGADSDQSTAETASEPVAASESQPASAAEAPVEASTAAPAATSAAEKPASAPSKPEVVQATDAEKQEYQQAYNALRTGHTDESITAFKAYLEKYPTGGYANNAQYWLGEAYRVNQDNDSARKAFNDVVDKYPNSAKVPDAILKLGYIEMDQKNSVKAREYLTRVTTEFPNTAAARLAAKKLLLLENLKN
ncbi:MAG: tol-pal system protein YbgF [Methylovulum sp.]